jgi:hypothetical protein
MRLAIVALMMAVSANASPIVYNEAVDGDLAQSDPLTLLTLGLGENTISGTFGENDILQTLNWASFAFIVPVGDNISSGSVSMTSTDIDESSWFLATGGVELTSNNTFAGTVLDAGLTIDGLSGIAVLHALPIGEGTYHIMQTDFQPVDSIFGVTTSSADFTFTLNLVSGTATTPPPAYLPNAPEPSTWFLTASGVALLLWRRGWPLRVFSNVP